MSRLLIYLIGFIGFFYGLFKFVANQSELMQFDSRTKWVRMEGKIDELSRSDDLVFKIGRESHIWFMSEKDLKYLNLKTYDKLTAAQKIFTAFGQMNDNGVIGLTRLIADSTELIDTSGLRTRYTRPRNTGVILSVLAILLILSYKKGLEKVSVADNVFDPTTLSD